MHVLIKDNETGTSIGGTVIEWYMQRQEICRVVDLHPMQIVGIKGQDLKQPRGYSIGM